MRAHSLTVRVTVGPGWRAPQTGKPKEARGNPAVLGQLWGIRGLQGERGGGDTAAPEHSPPPTPTTLAPPQPTPQSPGIHPQTETEVRAQG